MSRRSVVEDALKIVAVVMICAPLLPEARICWWVTMRAAQHTARRIGLIGLAAERKYREKL